MVPRPTNEHARVCNTCARSFVGPGLAGLYGFTQFAGALLSACGYLTSCQSGGEVASIVAQPVLAAGRDQRAVAATASIPVARTCRSNTPGPSLAGKDGRPAGAK